MLDSPLAKLALLAAALWAAHKYGSAEVRIAALGVAGVVLVNQLPVVRDGMNARIAA